MIFIISYANTILTLLQSLLPPAPQVSSIPLKNHDLIFFHFYCCLHICIHIHTCMDQYNAWNPFTLISINICLRLTICNWITCWGLGPGEDDSPSQWVLIACSSRCTREAKWISPFMLTCPLVFPLCWSCLGYHMAEISCVRFSYHIQMILSFNRYSSPLNFTIFLRLWCSLSLNCRNCAADLQIRPRHPIVNCSLHFHQLWVFFVMVPVWCKKQLLQEERGASLICGSKNILRNCSGSSSPPLCS